MSEILYCMSLSKPMLGERILVPSHRARVGGERCMRSVGIEGYSRMEWTMGIVERGRRAESSSGERYCGIEG